MSNTTSEFLKQHQIVRAGAGAGKTYTLTHKVMEIADEIYQREKRWPRIVVTTFTRKATQELRERLMLLALEEKPHLVEFINSRSHLMVSTIHGVMDLFLKRYGSHLDLDPGYTVVTGSQAAKLAKQVLRKVLLGGGGGADGNDADLLETIPFNRLCELMRDLDRVYGEDPEAAPYSVEDFERLFLKRALETARELESSAFNIREEATAAPWLKMADDYLALATLLKNPDWGVTREAFTTLVNSMATARFSAKAPPVSEMTSDDAKLARKSAKKFLKPVYDPKAWRDFVSQAQTLERVGRQFSSEFRKVKRQRGYLEINDLEFLAMETVRAYPAAAAAFASEWDHWLIDEYQDTSPFQVRLLRELTGTEPCFVVGDPQQSIYLFRGARSDVFAQREAEIMGGGGERKLLTVNRRSKPELLLFLNDFFGRFDPPFSPMEPFLEGDAKIDSSKVVAEIFIAQASAADSEHGESSDSSDATEASDDGDSASDDSSIETSGSDIEMQAIVARVQDLIEAGAKPEDICVLARTKKTLNDVADWLNKFGLPTHVHAASGFYERRETQDALAFLKFLINPHDAFNTVEVFRSPCFRLSDQLIAEIMADTKTEPKTEPKTDITQKTVVGSAARAQRASLWQALLSSGHLIKTKSDQLTVEKLRSHLGRVVALGLTGAFRNGLVESGFIDLSHVHDSSGRRESNIWKLLARLEREEGRAGFNPLAFVAGTAAELKIDEGGGEGDAVAAVEPDRINLMTIHASKGLEFGHVILPRMDQKPKLTDFKNFFYDALNGKWAARVPFGENGDFMRSLPEEDFIEDFKKQELAEHARVLYVALTRAIDSVFLSWTDRPDRNSWADFIRLDLSRGPHKSESYSYVVRDEAVRPRVLESAKQVLVEPRKKWLEKSELSAPASLSVTEILERQAGSSSVGAAGSTGKDVIQRLKVATTGTAVHKLMELLKYPSQERMGALIEKWFPGQSSKVKSAIDFVRDSSKPPLLSIIENGEVEWGFAMLERGLLIEGAIDLWGRAPDGTVWIIDYKTGNPQNKSKAFEQMTLYSLALRKSGLLAKNDRIQLAAVYPFTKEIYIEDEPSLEAIRARFGL